MRSARPLWVFPILVAVGSCGDSGEPVSETGPAPTESAQGVGDSTEASSSLPGPSGSPATDPEGPDVLISDVRTAGACEESPENHVDRAPLIGSLSLVDRWVEAQAIDMSVAALDDFFADGGDAPVSVEVVDQDQVAMTQDMFMFTGTLAQLRSVLADPVAASVRTMLGLSDHFNEPSPAPYLIDAIAIAPTGSFAFIGECQTLYTNEAEALIADGLLPEISQIVLMSGDEIEMYYETAQSAIYPPQTAAQLVPGLEEDPARTAGAVAILVELVAPGIEQVPDEIGLVCIRTAIAWGGCVSTQAFDNSESPVPGPVGLGAYIGDDGLVELWLVDRVDGVSKPLVRLGQVSWPGRSIAVARVELVNASALAREAPAEATSLRLLPSTD